MTWAMLIKRQVQFKLRESKLNQKIKCKYVGKVRYNRAIAVGANALLLFRAGGLG